MKITWLKWFNYVIITLHGTFCCASNNNSFINCCLCMLKSHSWVDAPTSFESEWLFFFCLYSKYTPNTRSLSTRKIYPKLICPIIRTYSFINTIFWIPWGRIFRISWCSLNNLNCLTKSSDKEAAVCTSLNNSP